MSTFPASGVCNSTTSLQVAARRLPFGVQALGDGKRVGVLGTAWRWMSAGVAPRINAARTVARRVFIDPSRRDAAPSIAPGNQRRAALDSVAAPAGQVAFAPAGASPIIRDRSFHALGWPHSAGAGMHVSPAA